MPFNPDKSKKAQEVIFSCVTQRVIHPPAMFNNMPVVCSSCQKYGFLRKLYNGLPRHSLITIYKSFIQLLFDYGAIIFDQPENENFCKKIDSVQYSAALAITGAIQGTSRVRLCKELGLEDGWKKCVACIRLKIMEFHLI